MSLEKIIERIQQDAKSEADEIRKKASAASEGIMEEAKEQASKARDQALENARKEAEQLKQRIISNANLEFRKDILAEKQQAIDSAFNEAMNVLLNMRDDEYQKVLRNIVVPFIQTGDEEIIFSEYDRKRFGKNLLREINNQLAREGKKGNVSISQSTYSIKGGVVLKRGNVELNNSFDSLFKSFRDDLEAEVSRTLFSLDRE